MVKKHRLVVAMEEVLDDVRKGNFRARPKEPGPKNPAGWGGVFVR